MSKRFDIHPDYLHVRVNMHASPHEDSATCPRCGRDGFLIARFEWSTWNGILSGAREFEPAVCWECVKRSYPWFIQRFALKRIRKYVITGATRRHGE